MVSIGSRIQILNASIGDKIRLFCFALSGNKIAISGHIFFQMKDIRSAEALVEGLPSCDTLGTLSIRVGLPQEEYPNQEQMLLGLAHVMQVP